MFKMLGYSAMRGACKKKPAGCHGAYAPSQPAGIAYFYEL